MDALMQNVPSVIRSRAELLLWLLFETSRKHASISPPRSAWLTMQSRPGPADGQHGGAHQHPESAAAGALAVLGPPGTVTSSENSNSAALLTNNSSGFMQGDRLLS